MALRLLRILGSVKATRPRWASLFVKRLVITLEVTWVGAAWCPILLETPGSSVTLEAMLRLILLKAARRGITLEAIGAGTIGTARTG